MIDCKPEDVRMVKCSACFHTRPSVLAVTSVMHLVEQLVSEGKAAERPALDLGVWICADCLRAIASFIDEQAAKEGLLS